MSGYTNFTWWITQHAKYALVSGKKCKILRTFFTSTDGCHNSDEFVLKLEGHEGSFFPFAKDNEVALDDFSTRYHKQLKEDASKVGSQKTYTTAFMMWLDKRVKNVRVKGRWYKLRKAWWPVKKDGSLASNEFILVLYGYEEYMPALNERGPALFLSHKQKNKKAVAELRARFEKWQKNHAK
ncbi:MAG: hypothetical protein AAB920_02470 [Patescibacteria group bacterium]